MSQYHLKVVKLQNMYVCMIYDWILLWKDKKKSVILKR